MLICARRPYLVQREQGEKLTGRSAGVKLLSRRFVQLAQVPDNGGFQVAERGAKQEYGDDGAFPWKIRHDVSVRDEQGAMQNASERIV
jgi:hypothetical protein